MEEGPTRLARVLSLAPRLSFIAFANAAVTQSADAFLSKLPASVIRNGCIVDVRAGLSAYLQSAQVGAGAEGAVGPWCRVSLISCVAKCPPNGAVLSRRATKCASWTRPSPTFWRSAAALAQTTRRRPRGRRRPLTLPQSRCGGCGGGGGWGGDGTASLHAGRVCNLSRAPFPVTCGAKVKTENAKETLVLKLRFHDRLADIRKYLDVHRAGCPGCGSGAYRLILTFPRKVRVRTAKATSASGAMRHASL